MAKRKNHSPEQIVRKLKTADELASGGASGEEIARQLGISTATLYNWRNRYGGNGRQRSQRTQTPARRK